MPPDPFWHWLLHESPLRDRHYPKEQIESIYARLSDDAKDYFDERAGILQFDSEPGTFDRLTAENVALMMLYYKLNNEMVKWTALEMEDTPFIREVESMMRKQGVNPDLMPSTEESEMEAAMLVAELKERMKDGD